MELIGKITAIASLIGLVFAVYFFNEGRYAYAKDLKSIEQRLEYKIQADQLNSTKERYWNLQERFGDNCEDCNNEKKKEMKELKDQIEEIKENIKIIKEK